jgi:hypothetical protein
VGIILTAFFIILQASIRSIRWRGKSNENPSD